MNANMLLDKIQQLRSNRPLMVAILAIDVIAMGYGWYYYWQVGQFNPDSIFFQHPLWWPLVADSPNAVLLFFIASLAYLATGWRNKWLDAFAIILNVYVGLWTSLLFVLYADSMGTWNWGSTNNVLFFAHFGMPLQAMLLLPRMREDRWNWQPLTAIAAILTAYIVVDYWWPVLHPAPFIHGRDTALHLASPILMAVVFAGFAWFAIKARAPQRTTPQ